MLSSGAHLTLIQFLSDFISAFIWLSLTCAWLAFGAHMAHTWLALGSHMAHIWRTSGAHLALARTRLALSSHLKTDFIIWSIVTVPFPVFCVCFYVHECIYTFGFTSKTSSSVFAHWAARLRSPPTRVFAVTLWFNFIATKFSVI